MAELPEEAGPFDAVTLSDFKERYLYVNLREVMTVTARAV